MPLFTDHVLVRPTHYGRQILREYCKRYPGDCLVCEPVEGGWVKMKLCQLMDVFGPHMYSGGQSVLEEEFLHE